MVTVQTLTFANVATVAKVLWPQRSCAAATKVCVVKQLLTVPCACALPLEKIYPHFHM